jgi:putative holliday junction resolvase
MRRGPRLGVDPGSVRVGVAGSDPDGILASPWVTLARDRTGLSEIAEIAAIVLDRRVVEVLVGLPTSMSGRQGTAATAARAYAVQIARAVAPVPVRVVDERLSTVTAQNRLREAGVKGRKQRRTVDQTAAAVILQAALDAERVSGAPPGSLVDPVPQPDGPAATTDLRRPGPGD